MFNHGTITAMMFLLVGVVYDRVHHRQIDNFGGLRTKVPVYAGIFSLAFFAALGLPGLSGFIGEALCFIGAFPVYRTLTIISLTGVVLTAGYVLWMLQRVLLGPLNPRYENLQEISGREIFTLAPLGAIVVILGIWPAPVLNLMTSSMNNLARIFAP
jgi:NADH-quinone oxidoreductase subunit M